jgi:hypothetical protein
MLPRKHGPSESISVHGPAEVISVDALICGPNLATGRAMFRQIVRSVRFTG